MAQIMNYYQFPVSGSGKSAAYTTWSGIDLPSVSFEVDYDWENMLNNYYSDGRETPQEIYAVAMLMYHCGLSVGMQYDIYESLTISEDIPYALMDHFEIRVTSQIR